MIKNLLYSLFLHFLLILVIYLNLSFQEIDQSKTQEIAVSLAPLKGREDAKKPTEISGRKIEEVKESPKEKIKEIEENKEAESPKISESNKVKKAPEKLAKAKVARSVKKAPSEEKNDEFKPNEKDDVKQKDAKKLQEDKTQNQNEDKKQNDQPKKEEDLGAKKESSEEIEESKKEKTKNPNINEMANSLENLDLSGREKFNIQSQLKYCYHLAIKESKVTNSLKVITKVTIERNGKINFNFDETVQPIHRVLV